MELKQLIAREKASRGIPGDVVALWGIPRLVCRRADGSLRYDTGWMFHNVITTAGKAQLALLGGDGTATAFGWLAVGTSTTAENASQTALVAEVTTNGLERAAATFSRVTTTTTNDTMSFYRQWTATGTVAVEEIGIFNASSGGTMLGRKLTGTKTVNSGETLSATYLVVLA